MGGDGRQLVRALCVCVCVCSNGATGGLRGLERSDPVSLCLSPRQPHCFCGDTHASVESYTNSAPSTSRRIWHRSLHDDVGRRGERVKRTAVAQRGAERPYMLYPCMRRALRAACRQTEASG